MRLRSAPDAMEVEPDKKQFLAPRSGDKTAKRQAKAEALSDLRAARAERAFRRMGNTFYKDPDNLILKGPESSPSTSSHSDEDDSTEFDADMAKTPKPTASNQVDEGHDPLADVMQNQVRATIMVVRTEVVELFESILGEHSSQLYSRQGGALPADYAVLVYAEDPAHMTELKKFVNLSVRETIRDLSLSPETQKDRLPLEVHGAKATKTRSSEEQIIEQGTKVLGDKQTAQATGRKSKVKRTRVGMPISFTAMAMACIAGALAAWFNSSPYEVRGILIAIGLFILRVIDFFDELRVRTVRHFCRLVYSLLGLFVDGLLAAHKHFGKVAAGQ
ncbi:hypothetical protein NMY22_g17598 [Coprinellus aureogranulatus]|nr:hypothetical protein NMY22_g17598 [Coprinellus aureogranulatus]